MERVSRDLPESPARRAARIARVGARYGFGFVFRSRLLPGRRREEPERIGTRLRLSLEELGPTFAELGRFLSARGDLLPPGIASELGNASAAVLPGERPALVVVRRPGVRRDLLAMRPVADLTRRRLGDRLALDPSVTVMEF